MTKENSLKERWDQRYAISDYYYGTEPNDFLKENLQLFQAKGKILCLAEGEGRNAVFLAKLGFDVTAVDISEVGLQKLSELANASNVKVKTICANLADFQIDPESWDGIISIWCHVPSALRAKLYKNCVSGLKKSGVILVEAYTPDQIPLKTGGPQDPDLMPWLRQLQEELKGLQVLEAQEIQREIHEGLGHNGLSAVVQFIGKKE